VSRVVVVGAGVGGLACALRLAVDGHEVSVYEQSDVVGGKLARYERSTPAGTFRFDTGPGLLTLPMVFADLFTASGSALADELDLVRLDPVARHLFPDGTVLDTTDDPMELAHRITVACGESAAQEWQRLWERAERVWSISWRRVLRSPVDGPLSMVGLAWRLRELAAIAPGRTLRGLGRGYLTDPRLRMLLDRYATYAGADPRRAPAALVSVPYAELAFGGWYVRGGVSTLADALHRRCLATGVEVHTGTRVTGIDTSKNIRLGTGDTVEADAVVSNVDALALYRDLLPVPARAARLTDRSLAGFVLLLGVRGRTPGLAHHTVVFPSNYDAEFDAAFGGTLAEEPTMYVTVPDDPLVRPDGHEAWFVLVNVAPHGPVDWRAPGRADAYADRILDQLAARGLVVRDRLLFREIRTPADLEAATGAPGGAIYGTPRHGLLRPANRGPVRGLYLVGGSTHPGGGLPLVALSAEIVARQLSGAGRRARSR
jgi:phytoene desaturase